MAAKVRILDYTINLPDKATVDLLNAEIDAGGGPTINPHIQGGAGIIVNGRDDRRGVNVAPCNLNPLSGMCVTAAQLMRNFDPSYTPASVPVIYAGDASQNPSLTSPWFANTNSSEDNYPLDVATFERCSGGWFGICLLFGSKVRHYWSGRFAYVAPLDPAAPETGFDDEATIPVTYFLDGAELPLYGEGGAGNIAAITRDASGFTEGYGYAFRDFNGTVKSHSTFEYLGSSATAPQDVWHRLYLTCRSYPGVEQGVIGGEGFPTSTNGWRITMAPSGQLNLYNVVSGTLQLLGTTAAAIPLTTRTKVDILINWSKTNSPTNSGAIRLYVRGALASPSSGSHIVTTGIGAAISREATSLLVQTPGGDNAFELDIDYWHCKAIPTAIQTSTGLPAESLTSYDWLHGSRTLLVRPKAEAADFSGWTAGTFRSAMARPDEDDDNAATIQSTTSGAIASYDTDGAYRQHGIPQAVGIGAMVVGLRSYRGTGSGDLGYNLNGGGDVYTAITQVAASNPGWNSVLADPSAGLDLPTTITSLELKHRKNADAGASGISALMAVVELMGVFGDEDVAEGETGPGLLAIAGVHNSAYPTSPWAVGSPTFGPFQVLSGLYTGNDLGQDLVIKVQPCWVFLRRVTGTGDLPYQWWTSLLGAHETDEQGIRPTTIVDCQLDPDFAGASAEDEQEIQSLIRIAGKHALSNATGVTYQYVAIADPAARFLLAGAFSHANTGPLPATNPLAKSDFTPTSAFYWPEDISVTTTAVLGFKGKGHGADAANQMGVGAVANALTFAKGSLTSRAGLHAAVYDQVAYLAMREDDGSGPYAVPPYRVATWVGDGAAARTISVDLGGKRPLFAWLIKSNGAAFWRDPSHLTTQSSAVDSGTETATSITGGDIDAVQVGTQGNVNAVVYHLWVVPGSATAGNGGWSINGEFFPIEPDIDDPDGTFVPPVFLPPTTASTASVAEPDLDNSTVLGTSGFNFGGQLGGQTCVFYTQGIVNRSLGHIGQSERITALATELTEAAVRSREHIREDINAVLRDFPWAFATRYVDLVLEAGTLAVPLNQDWIFSYRAPTELMFARRITKKNIGREFDPDPIDFRVGMNEVTGFPIIYCNAEATAGCPLELEYTVRQICPALYGDALFRQALEWKHAASLAGPLARDDERRAYCEGKYQATLAMAKVGNAREAELPPPTGDADWILSR